MLARREILCQAVSRDHRALARACAHVSTLQILARLRQILAGAPPRRARPAVTRGAYVSSLRQRWTTPDRVLPDPRRV